MNATWRRFFQGGSAGEGKISKTDSRANSIEVQCEACPLNQVEVGVAVRVKSFVHRMTYKSASASLGLRTSNHSAFGDPIQLHLSGVQCSLRDQP